MSVTEDRRQIVPHVRRALCFQIDFRLVMAQCVCVFVHVCVWPAVQISALRGSAPRPPPPSPKPHDFKSGNGLKAFPVTGELQPKVNAAGGNCILHCHLPRPPFTNPTRLLHLPSPPLSHVHQTGFIVCPPALRPSVAGNVHVLPVQCVCIFAGVVRGVSLSLCLSLLTSLRH